jgi:hypothetical protein
MASPTKTINLGLNSHTSHNNAMGFFPNVFGIFPKNAG